MNAETLGPAEKIIQTIFEYKDHLYHGRPGIVSPDSSLIGVRWSPVTHQEIDDKKVVFQLSKSGRKSTKTRIGILDGDDIKSDAGNLLGRYQKPGLFPEMVSFVYKQIAEVWKMDNEFSARWASFAFGEEHRDIKVVLAAFMLVQSRRGDPVLVDGKFAFRDQDFRDVGEAMLLLSKKNRDFNAKMIHRVYKVLSLPEVAKINYSLGFTKTPRRPFLGRWQKSVEKWLEYREDNPKMLEGLVKTGFTKTIIRLATQTGYKPKSSGFYQILRWKQKQAPDGRRSIGIGEVVKEAESWEGLSEEQICEKIVETRPGFKRLSGLIPSGVGLTRAILAAAIDSGCLSDKDMVILSPTLEEVGILGIQEYKEKWDRARSKMEDMRAANLALRMKSKETREALQETADLALQKSVAEVMRDLRVYFMVDKSGSMEGAIEEAKRYIAKFIQGFPLDKLHVSVFNQVGREVRIPHASAAGVENAFRGIAANGGTDYAQGINALKQYKPSPEEDVLMIFVGDEEANAFDAHVRQSGLNPMAFGLIHVGGGHQSCVRDTASRLGIPCFMIDPQTFEDPYAIPRTIRALIAATPVNQNAAIHRKRVSMIETILKTDLLQKPAWA